MERQDFHCKLDKQHWGGVSSQRRSRFERATRSLATFVRSHRSLRSLALQRSASLCSLRSLAPFTGSLTHFAHSLVGQLKILNMCSYCYRVSREQTRFWRSLETRPYFQCKRDDKLIAVFHILSFQSTVVNTMILMISNWLILISSILIINNSINQIFWKHLQVVENKIGQKMFWLFGPRKDNEAQMSDKICDHQNTVELEVVPEKPPIKSESRCAFSMIRNYLT